jgi:hypothetical protein
MNIQKQTILQRPNATTVTTVNHEKHWDRKSSNRVMSNLSQGQCCTQILVRGCRSSDDRNPGVLDYIEVNL